MDVAEGPQVFRTYSDPECVKTLAKKVSESSESASNNKGSVELLSNDPFSIVVFSILSMATLLVSFIMSYSFTYVQFEIVSADA